MVEAITLGLPVVLVDMPEILLRMHIGNNHTLVQLEEIFNTIANKINKGKCSLRPSVAAQELFPEVFLKPRDDYVKIMLSEIANDLDIPNEEMPFYGTKKNPHENILAYIGNLHVSPISRLWNTGEGETATLSPPISRDE